MTKDEKKHYFDVANLGCILCYLLGNEGTWCEIHHIRSFGGLRKLCPVIGLCPEHHRGNTGVHGMGKKAFERHYGYSEQDLLEITLSKL